MTNQTWTVDEVGAGSRLDLFLTTQVPEISRSQLQKWIKNGQVTVNGRKATVHHFLKAGDTVDLKVPSSPHLSFERRGTSASSSENLPSTPHAPPSSLDIIAETSDYLVIDKPAGLLVHPDTKTETGTLVDLLLAHDPNIRKVGERPEAPGIVHRLDREVSGLMVVAKKQDTYEALQKQFATRTVEKHYLALVHGKLSKSEGDIKFKIARSTSKARMAARPEEEEEGKAAWTHYVVKEQLHGAALLDIQILSGRTHQIRAHLYALGHPVIGDALYKLRRTERTIKPPRLMLQSVKLSFEDPRTGDRRHFEIPPDPAFAHLLKSLR